jgi:GAF domain/ANTAR domain
VSVDRVRELVRAAERAGQGSDAVDHLCQMAVAALPVDGVGLSVTGGPGRQSKVTATDDISGRIEDLQVLLGQGPCVDAVELGAPVLIPDLAEPSIGVRWPVFTPAASAAGVRASFAVPLVVGDVRLGAMDLYRAEVGQLDKVDVDEAQAYADAAVEVLLALQHTAAADAVSGPVAAAWAGSSIVHQATGMVMVQIDGDAAAAFASLRARAYQEDRALHDLARDVLERRVRFGGAAE